VTKTFGDNCDTNIVHQKSCKPLFPDAQMLLKMYKNKVENSVKDLQCFQNTHKMILKQHTKRSPKDYAPDGPISKEQWPI